MKITISKSQWQEMGKKAGWKVAGYIRPTEKHWEEEGYKPERAIDKLRVLLLSSRVGLSESEATAYLNAILSTPEGKKRAKLAGLEI